MPDISPTPTSMPRDLWDDCELSRLVFHRNVYYRIRANLWAHNIRTLDDLRRIGLDEVLRWPNFGRKSLNALREATGVFDTPCDGRWEGCELSQITFDPRVHRRLRNCLRQHNVRTLDDLRRLSLQAVMRWPNFGVGCLVALCDATGVFGDEIIMGPRQHRRSQRNRAILAARRAGRSCRDIAAEFRLSRVSVYNIVTKAEKNARSRQCATEPAT